MVRQAFKKKYAYKNVEKYRIFLKKKFISLTPRYYAVAASEEIKTADGPMMAVKIVYDDVENPNYEPIAEVWINDEYVYLWRDLCWTIAVDKNNDPVYKCQTTDVMVNIGEFTIAPPPCNKVLLIHQIGCQPVEV